MNVRLRNTLYWLLLAAGLPGIQTAVAAESGPGWEPGYTIVPYGWLAGINGEIGTSSADVDPGDGLTLPDRVDISVDGRLEKIGFMFFGEWRGERWHAFFDSVWANVAQNGRIGLGNILPESSVRAGIDGNIYELAVGYRLFGGARMTGSLYGGARYYDLDAQASFEGGLLPQKVIVSEAGTWTDAVVGTRLGYQLNDSWQGLILADLGFGESDRSWQMFATIGYRFNEWGTIVGGYRYMSLDYDTADYKVDLALHGPAIGVAFGF